MNRCALVGKTRGNVGPEACPEARRDVPADPARRCLPVGLALWAFLALLPAWSVQPGLCAQPGEKAQAAGAQASPGAAWTAQPGQPGPAASPDPALPPGQDQGLAEVNGARLAWSALGQGPPLLLITGYGATRELWAPDLVARLARNHRVILYDHRGMGGSSGGASGGGGQPERADAVSASGRLGGEANSSGAQPEQTQPPQTLDLLARDALGLLDALSIPRADILGWSMGAAVALEAALAQPQRVNRLVLYGACAEPKHLNAVVARLSSMSLAEFLDARFPPGWAESHPGEVARIPRPTGPSDPEAVAAQRGAMARWPGILDRLPRLARPVLVVAGEADWVCPPGQGEMLAARAPNATLTVLPGGHWLMYQDPEGLARAAGEWLK